MTLSQAKEILADSIKENGDLYNLGSYLAWYPKMDKVCLDGDFSLEELEAIVVYIRSRQEAKA